MRRRERSGLVGMTRYPSELFPHQDTTGLGLRSMSAMRAENRMTAMSEIVISEPTQ
jgi:hypothetical protein